MASVLKQRNNIDEDSASQSQYPQGPAVEIRHNIVKELMASKIARNHLVRTPSPCHSRGGHG